MLVSHVTTHVSLSQAIALLSETEILATIEIIGKALQHMGIKAPRIAVCGLNPHAGEGGMFGDEEIRIITPAIEKARAAGWHILGPLPPRHCISAGATRSIRRHRRHVPRSGTYSNKSSRLRRKH